MTWFQRQALCAVGVVVVGLRDKHGLLPLVSTTLGATITVVDASADAAVQVHRAGGNATVAVTAVFVEALSVSIGIAEDAWKGVGFHNVRASRREGKLPTANLSLAWKWLHEQGPSQLGTVAGASSESLSVLDGSTTPFVEFEDTLCDLHGSLVTWIWLRLWRCH